MTHRRTSVVAAIAVLVAGTGSVGASSNSDSGCGPAPVDTDLQTTPDLDRQTPEGETNGEGAAESTEVSVAVGTRHLVGFPDEYRIVDRDVPSDGPVAVVEGDGGERGVEFACRRVGMSHLELQVRAREAEERRPVDVRVTCRETGRVELHPPNPERIATLGSDLTLPYDLHADDTSLAGWGFDDFETSEGLTVDSRPRNLRTGESGGGGGRRLAVELDPDSGTEQLHFATGQSVAIERIQSSAIDDMHPRWLEDDRWRPLEDGDTLSATGTRIFYTAPTDDGAPVAGANCELDNQTPATCRLGSLGDVESIDAWSDCVRMLKWKSAGACRFRIGVEGSDVARTFRVRGETPNDGESSPEPEKRRREEER